MEINPKFDLIGIDNRRSLVVLQRSVDLPQPSKFKLIRCIIHVPDERSICFGVMCSDLRLAKTPANRAGTQKGTIASCPFCIPAHTAFNLYSRCPFALSPAFVSIDEMPNLLQTNIFIPTTFNAFRRHLFICFFGFIFSAHFSLVCYVEIESF